MLTRRQMLIGSLAAGGLLLGEAAPVAAGDFQTRQTRCPVDGTTVHYKFTGSEPVDLFRARDKPPAEVERDLRPIGTDRGRGTALQGALRALYQCPKCHYAAWRNDFAGPLTGAQKARILKELRPPVIEGVNPAWVSFDMAARSYAIRGAPHRRRATALCYAVYSLADDSPVADGQDRGLLLRKMRWSTREAIRLAIAGKEFSDKELCLARYLMAEMTRRGGYFSDAIDDFKKAATTPACPEWLAGWIQQQASKAKVGIAGDQ